MAIVAQNREYLVSINMYVILTTSHCWLAATTTLKQPLHKYIFFKF